MAERRPVFRSIKARLLALASLAVVLVWIGAALVTYRDARHEIREVLDAHLAQAASLVAAQALHELDEIETEHAPQLHRYARKVAFQVWEDGERLLLHSSNAPEQPLAVRREGFSEQRIDGTGWRVFTAWDARHHYLVHVGERLDARDDIVQAIAGHLLAPLLVAVPVLGALLWFAIARGLAPLQVLAREVAHRDPENLAPIRAQSAPTEAQPLVAQLNGLLDRVARALDNERRFTADAAHELRTPLAGIKAHAQVAQATGEEQERRSALEGVLAGCERMSRMTSQLLTLARLEAPAPGAVQPCRLETLAREVIAETAPSAVRKNVDIELAGHGGALVGDPDLLQVLVRNLVDNAVRYSPPGSTVRVEVDERPGEARLSVEDNGPGIPAAERAKALQRFHRGEGTGEEGSGLGLPIAQRVAAIHGGELTLGEGRGGRGLRVEVRFPRA